MEHTLDDRNTAQARVQMQVVSQLEIQVNAAINISLVVYISVCVLLTQTSLEYKGNSLAFRSGKTHQQIWGQHLYMTEIHID